jgi:putative phosphoesterase
MLSRIGLIGDVHAEDKILETALQILSHRSLDMILCVGDIVDGIGSADRCCELLIDAGVVSVRGNHDRWLLENQMRRLPHATVSSALSSNAFGYLSDLPVTKVLQGSRGRILLCHGLGPDDMWRPPASMAELERQTGSCWELTSCDLVLHGHTHVRGSRITHHQTLLNAGSLSGPDPAVLLVDLSSHYVEVLDVTRDGEMIKRFKIA